MRNSSASPAQLVNDRNDHARRCRRASEDRGQIDRHLGQPGATLPCPSGTPPIRWIVSIVARSNDASYVATPAVVTATRIYHGKRLEGSARFPAGTRVGAPMAWRPSPIPCSCRLRAHLRSTPTDMPTGGHFAAMGEPKLMLADLRAINGRVLGERC